MGTEDLTNVFNKVILFIKSSKTINKEDIVKYFDSILEVSSDNKELMETYLLEDLIEDG